MSEKIQLNYYESTQVDLFSFFLEEFEDIKKYILKLTDL